MPKTQPASVLKFIQQTPDTKDRQNTHSGVSVQTADVHQMSGIKLYFKRL